MSNAFVIKKKPFMYKLGARIFKYLILCNKVVEYEKMGKVIEATFVGNKYTHAWEEELKNDRCNNIYGD